MVVPISGGLSQRQVLVLEDLGGQVLCCTPSYALNIAAGAEASGRRLDTAQAAGRHVWRRALDRADARRDRATDSVIVAINVYGLSEIVGPGVSAECAEVRNGSHVQEDHFLPEIMDPQTGESLPHGEEGELVFTTITKEALPMLRYRTGDISALDATPVRLRANHASACAGCAAATTTC